MKEKFSRISLTALVLALFCLSFSSAFPGSTINTDTITQSKIFYNDQQEILHISNTTSLVSFHSDGSLIGKIRSVFYIIAGNLTITKLELITCHPENNKVVSRSVLNFQLAENSLTNNETQIIIDGKYELNETIPVIDQLAFSFRIYFNATDTKSYESFYQYTHYLTVGRINLIRDISLFLFAVFAILFVINFYLFTFQKFSTSLELILQVTYAITAISVINSGYFDAKQPVEIWLTAIFTPIALIIVPMIIDQRHMKSVVLAVNLALSTEKEKLQKVLQDPELTETKKKFLTKTHQVNIRSIKSKYLQRMITYINERMLILMTILFFVWIIFELRDLTITLLGSASIVMILFILLFPDPRPDKIMQNSIEK